MRVFQIVLEIIWFFLGAFCLYGAWRVHAQHPTQGWVFVGMGIFAFLMGVYRLRTRRRREKRDERRDKNR